MFNARSLDVNLVTPTKALLDDMPIDLFAALEVAKFRHQHEGKPMMMVECPVCLFPTGIMLIDHKKPQTCKCTQCTNVSIFVQTALGNWKIKSIVGTERIDERGKSWVNKRI